MVYLMTGMNLTEFNRNTVGERTSLKHTVLTEGSNLPSDTLMEAHFQSSHLLLLSEVPLAYEQILVMSPEWLRGHILLELRIIDAVKLFEPGTSKRPNIFTIL